MIQGRTILPLFIAFLLNAIPAYAQTSDRELMDQIITKIESLIEDGELERRELTFTVEKGQVKVTGRIEHAEESRLILDSILATDHLKGIQLNLGVGRNPSPAFESNVRPWFDAELWKRPLDWDDGHWDLDFDPQPLRRRINH